MVEVLLVRFLVDPSACVLANNGLSQHSSKEEYEPRKWGATARYYASHTDDHVTDEEVCAKTLQTNGPQEDLLTIVKTRKLKRYVHVSLSLRVAQTILQCIMKGGRRQGRQKRKKKVGRQHHGMNRPGVRQVPEDVGEHGKMEETVCEVICGAPSTSAVKG